ncbi:alpha/beta-hydrolase [Auricularia subglabra TFB-10046 SS5]|nr:alpha/beta-hydrolase [Auricularia subglabra TFB-10046 SS5]
MATTNNRESYARPAVLTDSAAPYAVPDRLLPLRAPPSSSAPPYVPPSRGAWRNGWTRSTHVCPAAYPRQPTLRAPDGKPSFDDILRRRQEHYDGRAGRIERRGEVMWTVVERFALAQPAAPSTRPVTLVCAHANGLHKETFDETLDHLLTKGLSGGEVVGEVWMVDAVTQGEGARINASELPDVFDWTENARDLLSFILAYLPESASITPPPVLGRLPDSGVDARRTRGFAQRRLVALGHSQGGAAMVLAAAEMPALFDALVLVDPVIVAPRHVANNYNARVAGAAKRRDVWPSREDAAAALGSSPFFQRWHPAVLRAYVEHALYASGPSGEVQLKCTPYQEATSFSETRAPAYAWHHLASIPPRVALFWVLAGGDENHVTGGDAGTPHTVWRRPENTRNVRVEGAGHLIVQQKPAELAHLLSEFLVGKYGGVSAARM